MKLLSNSSIEKLAKKFRSDNSLSLTEPISLKSLSIISPQNFDELSNINVQDAAIQHGYDTALYNSGNKGLVLGDFGTKARALHELEKISE